MTLSVSDQGWSELLGQLKSEVKVQNSQSASYWDDNTPHPQLSSNLKTCSQDGQNESGVQRLWRGHYVHHHDYTLREMYLSAQTYHKVSSFSFSPKLSEKIILWNWKAR